jgi:hypothetical protein
MSDDGSIILNNAASPSSTGMLYHLLPSVTSALLRCFNAMRLSAAVSCASAAGCFG